MSSYNRVILIGYLGRDCELRFTQGGTAVATVNMATSEVWTDKQGQRQDRTEWHRVVLWGKSAESLSEYLKKGKQIAVEGKLQTREWKDKKGEKRYTTEVRADRIVLLGGAPKDQGARHVRDEEVGHGEPAMAVASGDGAPYDDDIPF